MSSCRRLRPTTFTVRERKPPRRGTTTGSEAASSGNPAGAEGAVFATEDSPMIPVAFAVEPSPQETMETLSRENQELRQTVVELTAKLEELLISQAEREGAEVTLKGAINELELKNQAQQIKLEVLQSLYEEFSEIQIPRPATEITITAPVGHHTEDLPSHPDSDSSLSEGNNSSSEPGLAPSFGSYTESETSTSANFDPLSFEAVWETSEIAGSGSVSRPGALARRKKAPPFTNSFAVPTKPVYRQSKSDKQVDNLQDKDKDKDHWA
mgnify:CR=1 FL=1